MTNNDKALETMPDAGCYHAWGVWAFQNKETIRQALTPQSSADLGRVLRARVDGMKRVVKDGHAITVWGDTAHNAAIESVLRTIDEVIREGK